MTVKHNKEGKTTWTISFPKNSPPGEPIFSPRGHLGESSHELHSLPHHVVELGCTVAEARDHLFALTQGHCKIQVRGKQVQETQALFSYLNYQDMNYLQHDSWHVSLHRWVALQNLLPEKVGCPPLQAHQATLGRQPGHSPR